MVTIWSRILPGLINSTRLNINFTGLNNLTLPIISQILIHVVTIWSKLLLGLINFTGLNNFTGLIILPGLIIVNFFHALKFNFAHYLAT